MSIDMKKIAISGSWRLTNDAVKQDVEETVVSIVADYNRLVTGGALGVDMIATKKILVLDKSCKHLLIILPTTLEIFATHFRNRAGEGVITKDQAEDLIELLSSVKAINPQAIIEMDFLSCDQQSYYARNGKIIDMADELYAFQVNGSKGTQDAIDKAKSRNIPVIHKKYKI